MIASLPASLIREEVAEYYALSGAILRRDYLAAHPDLPDCALRRKWLERRSFSLSASGEADAFMRAWSLLQADCMNKPGIFSRRAREKALRQLMTMLGLSDYALLSEAEQAVLCEEWADFTRLLAHISLRSKAYGSTLFGLMTMKEEEIEAKFAQDILNALVLYPEYFGMADAFAPLYAVMRETCLFLLPETAQLLP